MSEVNVVKNTDCERNYIHKMCTILSISFAEPPTLKIEPRRVVYVSIGTYRGWLVEGVEVEENEKASVGQGLLVD